MKKVLISIFTPTFNRGSLLRRLYDSIKKQRYLNCEWIIVDDGSTDNTKKIVEEFINENCIKIKYIQQENSGKHLAINTGIKNAEGEYFIIVDSDDYLSPNALTIIEKFVVDVDSKKNFIGIAGLKNYKDGKLIGSTFKGKFLDCTSLERRKNNINGDKAEVFKTKLLKKYPFPKIDNEKFLPEAYIWNKIAADGFKFRWINECLIICEYMQDGITNNAKAIVHNNYKGQLLYIKDLIKYDNNFIAKIAHYSSYCGIASQHYTVKKIIDDLKINIISYYIYLTIYKLRNR